FRPYLYKTTDYGKTWTKIVTGIKDDHFTRVVRADPNRPGLLYAGTESGMYVSFDDGENWKRFQLNLPVVPVTDLAVKDDDLIVDANGAVVREYRSDADSPGAKLDAKAGMNRVVWDLRHADAEGFPGLVIWGSLTGPRAVPGSYQARLTVGSLEETVEFTVKP